MQENRNLKELKPILKQYGIETSFIESMGKIHKIYGNHGVYVLKKVDPHHGIDFIKHVQSLYQKGFNRIVPIYPTLDGRYAILHNQELYYLMPWLPDIDSGERNDRQKQLFRELARLHSISSREIPVNKEERKEHFEKTIIEYEQEEEFLLGLLETCERKIYMSPLELTYCTYYFEVHQALQYSKRKLREWYDVSKDQEKVRVSVIHGKVSNDHFLYNEKGFGYFINFEKAQLGLPSHDLLSYLAKVLKGFPRQSDDEVELVYTYFKYFPLKEEEMNLFLSYFAHPTTLIKTTERLFQQRKKISELKAVQKLQKDYWQLKNSEYVVMRIDQIEQQKKKEEEARKEQ